ncbi:MAG TPA: DUF2203 domain-containing protein [Pyrinomonadaceae bacterium]|nr:DUF2203 domain-containing protein [Pyrinomonadaceae bacterium]
MKLFTVDEANSLLPVVRPLAERVRQTYRQVTSAQEAARRAAEGAALGGGGMAGGSAYVAALAALAECAARLEEMGVQLKDYERGLLDFPALREGSVVLLCWHPGEGDRIEWWHDTEAGFAGRRPL